MTPLQYHVRRATDLYDQWRIALAKVDAYEREALAKSGGDPVIAVGTLLSDRTNPRPAYKALTGAKDGLQNQLMVELGMASLYLGLQPELRGSTQVEHEVTRLYRRMKEHRL